MRKFVVANVIVIAGLAAASPAFAFTHHPATKAERAQTRDLNLQQLAVAQGHAPDNMQANTGAPAAANTSTDNNAGSMDQPAAPAAPSAQATPQSSQPAAPQTPQTNQAPATAPQTSPQQ